MSVMRIAEALVRLNTYCHYRFDHPDFEDHVESRPGHPNLGKVSYTDPRKGWAGWPAVLEDWHAEARAECIRAGVTDFRDLLTDAVKMTTEIERLLSAGRTATDKRAADIVAAGRFEQEFEWQVGPVSQRLREFANDITAAGKAAAPPPPEAGPFVKGCLRAPDGTTVTNLSDTQWAILSAAWGGSRRKSFDGVPPEVPVDEMYSVMGVKHHTPGDRIKARKNLKTQMDRVNKKLVDGGIDYVVLRFVTDGADAVHVLVGRPATDEGRNCTE